MLFIILCFIWPIWSRSPNAMRISRRSHNIGRIPNFNNFITIRIFWNLSYVTVVSFIVTQSKLPAPNGKYRCAFIFKRADDNIMICVVRIVSPLICLLFVRCFSTRFIAFFRRNMCCVIIISFIYKWCPIMFCSDF